jgi:fluoride ion exporter CrcB/FEX
MESLLILLFGASGVFLRYSIDKQFVFTAAQFPVSTFVINCVGSLVIGILYVAGSEAEFVSRPLTVALTVGFRFRLFN